MPTNIQLPGPQKELEFPLMKALEWRRTKRKFKNFDPSDQELSNLLWAACGITLNESKTGKCRRTAPSAGNSQTIRIYIALEKGLFLYDEKGHRLIGVIEKDIRPHLSNQKMMKSAPVGIIYVADFMKIRRYAGVDEHQKWFIAGTETGYMSQNVYLYCASTHLNTAVIGLVDRDLLHRIIGLSETDRVVFTQVIGKPPFDKQI